MYLVPPMADEPPREYVAFVATHVDDARRDAARLTGGDPDGSHLYMDAFTDVAGHWRRLVLLGRARRALTLPPADTTGDYLARRLAAHTRHWRADQIYDVDIEVFTDQRDYGYARPVTPSAAVRKAPLLLADPARTAAIAPLADAAISWVHAYRRASWRRVALTVASPLAVLTGTIEFFNLLTKFHP